MSIPAIILAIVVIYTWLPSAKISFKKQYPESHDWFIVGVVIGFLGSIIDNVYWTIPWSALFLDSDIYYKMIHYGVYINIFFRQGCGILAAYCHLKSAELSLDKNVKILNNILIISNMIALVYVVTLLLIKLF